MEKVWKEVVMDYCKVLSQHLPEGTEECHENLSLAPPEYKSEALLLEQTCSVTGKYTGRAKSHCAPTNG
jgi:hypothetical protein